MEVQLSFKPVQGGEDVIVPIADPRHIDEAVKTAQNELAGEGSGIYDHIINLAVTAPDVPDLTIIELPGLVEPQTQHLHESYCVLRQSRHIRQLYLPYVIVCLYRLLRHTQPHLGLAVMVFKQHQPW